jgi:hypothetical protein
VFMERSLNPALATRSGGLGDKRKKQILAAASVVLLLLLAIQVPKTLHRLNGSTTATAAPAVVTPSASATRQVPAAPSRRAAARLLRNLPARDPFVPGIRPASTASPSTSVPALPNAGAVSPSPAQLPPASSLPKVAPRFARFRVNGQGLTVGVGQGFPAAAPVFRLTSLRTGAVQIAVIGGTFANGAKTITVSRGHSVTLVNRATGVRYVVSFDAPATAGAAAAPVTTPSTPAPSSSPGTTVNLPAPSGPGN